MKMDWVWAQEKNFWQEDFFEKIVKISSQKVEIRRQLFIECRVWYFVSAGVECTV